MKQMVKWEHRCSMTSNFSPKLAISIEFNLCNQDTSSQLRTAFLSSNSVLNREVLLHWEGEITALLLD
jgi:hypothetical protein